METALEEAEDELVIIPTPSMVETLSPYASPYETGDKVASVIMAALAYDLQRRNKPMWPEGQCSIEAVHLAYKNDAGQSHSAPGYLLTFRGDARACVKEMVGSQSLGDPLWLRDRLTVYMMSVDKALRGNLRSWIANFPVPKTLQ